MRERLTNNTYKMELPGDMHVSGTFDLGDLAPYVEDAFKDLRAHPSHDREVDAYQDQANSWLDSYPYQRPNQPALFKKVTTPALDPGLTWLLTTEMMLNWVIPCFLGKRRPSILE